MFPVGQRKYLFNYNAYVTCYAFVQMLSTHFRNSIHWYGFKIVKVTLCLQKIARGSLY
jgi:hypothetical protein